ncbi:unnamed protein product [Strongylus vulgaris]|uniref:Uncharacterized protein n=1 Tax=Strongylus vulgaris TaxID=40348 RepID=A0A3P7J7L3_STRVU|nr:unnamed protein product [Strongylus vulgaris]
MHEILLYEDTLGVDIKLEKNGFDVIHPPDVPVKPIEMGLKKLFYDVEFTKCLRLSTLRLRCPASQELTLTPAQFALLHERKLAVTRSVGLADILMDYNCQACMFGTYESVFAGRTAVIQLFDENGLGPFEIKSALMTNPNFDTSHFIAQIQSTDQSGSSNSFGNGSQPTTSDLVSPVVEPSSMILEDQRKSIRGANKRRIEQLTGCSILLHTEKKEYGEFPVEVFASSSKRCETARRHILCFLASGQATVDEVAAKLAGVKNKEVCPHNIALSLVTEAQHRLEINRFPAQQDMDENFEKVMKIVQRFRKEPQNWPIEEQPFGIIERTFVEINRFPAQQDMDENFEKVMKIVQRFRKEPQKWPIEEQPFGIIERTFVGTMMHPVELRPERGFVNMVPMGFMVLRHFFRKIRAKGNFGIFKSTGIFEEEEVRQGAKRVFEVISQHATKDNMKDLVRNNVCGDDLITRFEGASSHMSAKQRELLNLTEKDIYAIAPGVLGPFQIIRPVARNGSPYISYSLLCCAFYKKQLLFDAVRDLPLMDESEKAEFIPIPPDYGYAAPRLIFGFTSFGNKILGWGKVDPDVQLLDFQYLVI